MVSTLLEKIHVYLSRFPTNNDFTLHCGLDYGYSVASEKNANKDREQGMTKANVKVTQCSMEAKQ
jgi:hypothetical protein